VNLGLAIAILLIGESIAIGLMLLVRRRAPIGSFFKDTAEAAGVFAVVGTAFAVLLAFVFFLAFESYDAARNDARKEAEAAISMFRTAQLFPAPASQRLEGDVQCYSRAVIEREWPAMRHGDSSPLVQDWIEAMESTVHESPIAGDKQTAALTHWFDLSETRQEGRRGRLAESTSVVPPLVWLVIVLGGLVVVLYTCLFADPSERRLSQSLMMVATSSMVLSSLLVVYFLDHPYRDQGGSIRPSAMRTALRVMEGAQGEKLAPAALPCDASGRPRRLAS
jgi:hypothetical protein